MDGGAVGIGARFHLRRCLGDRFPAFIASLVFIGLYLAAGIPVRSGSGQNGCGPDAGKGVALEARQSAAQATELRAFLPSDKEPGGWRRDGEPQEFSGEDLYLYIDGGAAIYQEYGFVRVLAQDYEKGGGRRLSLEIFQMAAPEAAYGMFTFKRSAKGETVPVGGEGQLEDYYLNFWKGSFLVTLTGSGKEGLDRRELVTFARAVAQKIPGGPGSRPPLIARLPQTGLVRTSVRYFRGFLGFMNYYPSLAKEEFGVREGVRGDYSSGASLFVLEYSGPDEARSRLAAVEKAFRSVVRSQAVASPDGVFRAIDDRGKKVTLEAEGGAILMCIEDASGNEAAGLFAEAVKARR